MAIPAKVSAFLDQHAVTYSVMKHPHTSSSLETAEAAHVPGSQLAKSVILRDGRGYVMAVVPATHQVKVGAISQIMDRDLDMAFEEELGAIFVDCELGAVPPFGPAYKMETVWDDSLAERPDVFLESGDHEVLIRMKGASFAELMKNVPHGHISTHI